MNRFISTTLAAIAVAATAGCVSAPSNLDLSLTRPTVDHKFVVTLQPPATPAAINQLHSWQVRLASPAGVPVALGTDVGGGTTFWMLGVLDDVYQVAQLRGYGLAPLHAFYLATLGAARALDLDSRIGSFATGREADFVVLDPAATPLLARRTAAVGDIAETLFLLMTLGDDRAVARTYLMGRLCYDRDAPVSGAGCGE